MSSITCHLSHDGLRDPPIVQKGFDLLFNQVAVSPIKAAETHYGITTITP